MKLKITKKHLIVGSVVIIGGTGLIYLIAKIMKVQGNPINISAAMQSYIEKQEGFSPVAYPDVRGDSIGFGHHGTVNGRDIYDGMTIDLTTAGVLLAEDIQNAINIVNSQLTIKVNQNQFDALVDFEFNTGADSTGLYTAVNNNDWQSAAEFLQNHYKTAGGEPNSVLQNRRNYEADLLLA